MSRRDLPVELGRLQVAMDLLRNIPLQGLFRLTKEERLKLEYDVSMAIQRCEAVRRELARTAETSNVRILRPVSDEGP